MAESNDKEEAIRLIERLQDDATWEDIEYAIHVRRKIEAGLKDSREGRVIPHEEVRRRFKPAEELPPGRSAESTPSLREPHANLGDVSPWEEIRALQDERFRR